jgi:hypothetical protein
MASKSFTRQRRDGGNKIPKSKYLIRISKKVPLTPRHIENGAVLLM